MHKKIYQGNIQYYFLEIMWVLCVVVLPVYLLAAIFNIIEIVASIEEHFFLICASISVLLCIRRLMLVHLFIYLDDPKLCYKEGILTGRIIGYTCIDLIDKETSITTFRYGLYFEGIKIQSKYHKLIINNLLFSKKDFERLKVYLMQKHFRD